MQANFLTTTMVMQLLLSVASPVGGVGWCPLSAADADADARRRMQHAAAEKFGDNDVLATDIVAKIKWRDDIVASGYLAGDTWQ